MSKDNPFALTKKEGPKPQILTKTLTKAEQNEKLAGYLEISKEHWPQIRYGTHIRYFLKTGEFRTGGFVGKNPLEVVNPETKKIVTYIKLQNGFNLLNSTILYFFITSHISNLTALLPISIAASIKIQNCRI